MTDRFQARLSDYLDGMLTDEEQRLVERHIVECVECADIVEELREVVARAGTLEERQPHEDLWPGIASRIAGEESLVADAGTSPRAITSGRRLSFSIPQLAAAAVALMAVSASGVWVAMAGGGPEAAPTPVAQAPAPVAPAVTPFGGALIFTATGTAAESSAGRYAAAIAELERAIFEDSGDLDPETVRKLRESLAIIDRAIDDAQRALEADETDAYLNQHMVRTLLQKAEFLRQTANLLAVES